MTEHKMVEAGDDVAALGEAIIMLCYGHSHVTVFSVLTNIVATNILLSSNTREEVEHKLTLLEPGVRQCVEANEQLLGAEGVAISKGGKDG